MKKRAPRFYTQFSKCPAKEDFLLDDPIGIEYPAGWLVFDRHNFTPRGAIRPIAWAIGRHTAYRIRDALNKTEPAQ